MNLKNIINEWFALLPKGFAHQPYSKAEIDILESVLIRNNIDIKSVMQTLVESNALNYTPDLAEADVDGDGKDDSSDSDRFIAKSQPWMQSANEFESFILANYTKSGQSINNIDGMYDRVVRLDPTDRQEVVKKIGLNSKRALNHGGYSMGKYEKLLFDIIKSTIKIPNGHFSELWFAIIHDGEVSGAVATAESPIESDVDVGSDGVSLKNYSRISNVDFGKLPGDLASEFRDIVAVFSLMTGAKIKKSFGRQSINGLLDVMTDEGINNDVRDIIELGNTTAIKSIKRLADKLNTYLSGRDPEDIVKIICDKIDAMIDKKVASVDWWGIISGDTVYLERSSDIIASMKTVDNRLPKSIASFHSFNLWANGNVLRSNISG